MKHFSVVVLIVILVAILGLYLVSFQVRETELALVTTFGKPAEKHIDKPGWYFQWPQPIQKVHKFDSRMKVFEAELGETTTKGTLPIIVNTYVVWRITEPLKFFNAVGTVTEAENKLRSQLGNTQNNIIGQHYFGEFINSDPKKIKFKTIEDEMLADIAPKVEENYGIKIETIGIKQLKISEDASKAVFERMIAERGRRTKTIETQGTAEATRIKEDALYKENVIMAAAEARAMRIKGAGDAEAAKYYEMFDDDPEFAMFLMDIETVKKTLKDRATIIITTETEPYDILKKSPDIKPKKK